MPARKPPYRCVSLAFAGSIAMVGDEIYPPYERPPLSKEYFAGDKSFDRILIRPPAFWAERQVELLLGKRVDTIDPATQQVAIGQELIGYERLIWCTGGSPRKLTCDGATAPNVHAVRRRDDVDAMMAQMPAINHVTIVGDGSIGLEAAAVLTKLGKKVVLLEALDRVCGRSLRQHQHCEQRDPNTANAGCPFNGHDHLDDHAIGVAY